MTVLDEILALKRRRVAQAKAACDFSELKIKAHQARQSAKSFALSSRLKNSDRIHVIAEIKRASPSKGVINDKIDVAETARSYERGGAAAISVLTEEDKFQGSLEDLKLVRQTISLPILRKDFIFDEFQITEAAASGADAVLLIAAMLDDETLLNLRRLAENELRMDALVEVHTGKELERAEGIGATLIGVNNRDLHSFEVSLDVSRELIKFAPLGATLIAESGLQTREDLAELKNLGFRGFLIGETLMRSADIEKTLKELSADELETQ